MGRQTRFYMMDERNVRILAETFMQNGFELILSKRIQNGDGKVSVIFEPTRIDNSVLVQTQYLRGVNRFRKPEYREFNCFYESPHIEWGQRPTKLCNGRLPVSRLCINTYYSDRWPPEVFELLQKDYKALIKVVNKLTPLTSVDRNGSIVRARMDTVAVEYVKKGYHLGI